MKQTKGFTLVELAIVITIIGLLIGAVVKGQDMVQQGNVTATIAQIRATTAATKTFFDIYKAVPGDMEDAVARLPACNAGNSCSNGDGNSLIGFTEDQPWKSVNAGITSENTQFWKHLALAKLVKGINTKASSPAWDETHPTTAIGPGLHVGSTDASASAIYDPLAGNLLLFRGNIAGTTSAGFISISPHDASIIDLKMDDGIAIEGRVQAVSQNLQDGCGQRNHSGTGPMGYAETSTVLTCDLMMKLE